MLTLPATVLSEGIAYSKAFNISSRNEHKTSFLGEEASKKQFNKAIKLSIKQLEKMLDDNEEQTFINAHILLLSDPALHEEVYKIIREEHMNAIDAFTKVIDKYVQIMANANSEYLRQRYLDFLDIKARVIQNFSKMIFSLENLGECILMMEEIYPSLLVNISKNVKGIIVRQGGLTSHSAIMCRSMGIPFVVVDFPDDFNGDVLIGEDVVYFNPDRETINKYSTTSSKRTYSKEDFKGVGVYANVINNNDLDSVTDEFSGIGLYRTEFLLMDKEYAFDYNKQAEVYLEALDKMNGRTIVFRTFDFGGDKQIEYLPILQKGLINYYKYPILFENQIKALLIANNKYPGKVKIMFPMIETYKQFQDLKNIVIRIAIENDYALPLIGMMLETPTAFFTMSTFADVDFISVGTNDLCSALFNISREKVLLFDNLYTELLKVLEQIIEFANGNNIHLSVCGEIISQKEFAKKAINLGLKNVSISPKLIKNIYSAVNEE